MSKILTPLINLCIDSRFYMVHEHFKIQLDTLKNLGLKDILDISAFVHDNESVPLLKGGCDEGGVTHDWLCRKDSDPVVSKKVAADCYFEVMETLDRLRSTNNFGLFKRWIIRWVKYSTVVIVPKRFYFHKFSITTTYEEMSK